jgi:hypothetical protein
MVKMTKYDLQIFSGSIVTESKLSKPAKLQMLTWLEHEATEAQLKAFILDGSITKLDKQAEQIVNDRFSVHEAGGRVAKFRKSFMSVAGAQAYLGVPYLIYRTIRGNFDKCTKKCGTYELNTSRRQHCMIKCKVAKLTAELAAVQKTKDSSKIELAKAKLAKAKQAMDKSVSSFKSRKVEM